MICYIYSYVTYHCTVLHIIAHITFPHIPYASKVFIPRNFHFNSEEINIKVLRKSGRQMLDHPPDNSNFAMIFISLDF